MNERMIELANKANEDIGYTFKLEDAGKIHELMEKFAELIIKECAGVCESYRGTEWGKAAECIGDSIKEHFEVE